jgi:hypothetical protein
MSDGDSVERVTQPLGEKEAKRSLPDAPNEGNER